MTTKQMSMPPVSLNLDPSKKRKQGITENKKAELDKLGNQVITAQQNVEKLQAIVNSLTAKSAQFTGFLTTANNNKTHALANKNTILQLADTVKDLMQNCRITASSMDKAKNKTNKLALVVQDLINKLIYSAELINKLSNVIIRQKALNPLISNDLIDMVGTAGKDANNAVALTLVALESTFACQASNVESTDISILDYLESINLYKKLTGTKLIITGPVLKKIGLASDTIELGSDTKPRSLEILTNLKNVHLEFKPDDTEVTDQDGKPVKKYTHSLLYLIEKAYTDAEHTYNKAYAANLATTNQLNKYNAGLNYAQTKLKSLQLGLAAANAAALAS